ncbi:MAG: DUF1643 domain-containing protein [Leptolyngbyaceae cyanobacterium]
MLTIVTNSSNGSATFDNSHRYRYSLTRRWTTTCDRSVTFIMLNPSQADADRDDPTLRACSQFAKHWGYTQLEVVNLFAYRTTQPSELTQIPDPIGPENDRYVSKAVEIADRVILAWGNWGTLLNRAQFVTSLLSPHSRKLYCLERNRTGQPRHPLYIKRTIQPRVWINS